MALKEEMLTQFCSVRALSQFISMQVYVNDNIFGATNEILCEDFSKLMQIEFE